MEPNTPLNPVSVHNSDSPELAGDLLRGGDEIAEFIFGTRGSRRKVYYLTETSHRPVSARCRALRPSISLTAVDCRSYFGGVTPWRFLLLAMDGSKRTVHNAPPSSLIYFRKMQ